jgi:CheY-like chemotaxis protein
MFNPFKSIYSNSNEWPTLSLDEIRKRSRILVVDDNDFAYKVLFDKDDYNVDKWDDIDNINRLEDNYYDIILLDLQGIGKNQSADEGLGILNHLKNASPAQIIIAYSNADFNLKHQPFFQKADAVLYKHQDYIDFKRVIDQMLINRFSRKYYFDMISSNLKDIYNDNKNIAKYFDKSIKSNDKTIFEKFIHKYTNNVNTVNFIIKVLSTATSVYKILGNLHGN